MNKRNTDLTLENIGKLIDAKLEIKLAQNNAAIFGEIDRSAERLEERINSLEQAVGGIKNEVNSLKNEMVQRFDEVDDKLQNLLNEVDIVTDQKLEKFRQKYLAV